MLRFGYNSFKRRENQAISEGVEKRNGYIDSIAGREKIEPSLVAKTDSVIPGSREGRDAAKYLPGYDAEKVWLVKKENGFELYSNGARVLTEFETENHPRNYYLYS